MREAKRTGILAVLVLALVIPSIPVVVGAGDIPAWTPLGLDGGSIDFILVSPAAGSTVYATVDQGGLYKSQDAGTTWVWLGPPLGAHSVQALTLDPTNPEIIYASVLGSFSLFRSADGGATWSELPTGLDCYALALTVDPFMPKTIFHGSQCGVFKSSDSGQTWVDWNNGITAAIKELRAHPQTKDVILAAPFAGEILRTTDGGMTWSTGIGVPVGAQGFSINFDPSDPDNIYLGTAWGVYKSVDAGVTWGAINNGLPDGIAFGVEVHPVDNTNLYLALRNFNDSSLGGVYKSTDSGQTWFRASQGIQDTELIALGLNRDQPSMLYAGTFSGFLRSTNSAESWSESSSGIWGLWVGALSVASRPVLYAAGNTSAFASDNSGKDWRRIPTPGMSVFANVLPSPTDHQTILLGGAGVAVKKSLDGGLNTFDYEEGLGSRAVRRFALHPDNPLSSYAGTTSGVFVRGNGDPSWTLLGLDGRDVQDLAFDPNNSSILFAGTSSGIFRTVDGGANWEDVNFGGGLPTWIQSVAVDPGNSDIVLAGTSSFGVVRSSNGGSFWTQIDLDLGNEDVRALAFESTKEGSIAYAGAVEGLFRSEDSALTWTDHTGDLVNRKILSVTTESSELYIGVMGGGGYATADLTLIFADGFESGDTSAWSE